MAAILALSFFAGIPVQASFAAGATHYVSPTGTAAWAESTSISSPTSLATALSNYVAGDTVYLRGGTYSSYVTFSRSGTSASRVTIARYANETPVFNKGLAVSGSYLDMAGFEVTVGRTGIGTGQGQVVVSGTYNNLSGFDIHDTIDGAGLAFVTGASYNRFSDFRIANPFFSGIIYQGGTAQDTATAYNTVINGEVVGAVGHVDGSGNGSHASIDVHGTGNVIDGVDVHDTLAPSPWDGDGIRPHGIDLVIRNCRIYNIMHGSIPAHTDAIQFWDHNTNLLIENNIIGSYKIGGIPDALFPNDNGSQDAGTNIMMEAMHRTDVTVRNNLFLGSSYLAPINLNASKPYADSQLTVRLYNNTFFARGPVVLNTTTSGLPVTLTARGNIFAGGSTYGTRVYTPGLQASNVTLSSDYNVFVANAWKPAGEGSHSKVAAPLFVNSDVSSATGYGQNADFRLQATSPAIGAADAAYAPATDLTGASRVGAPDAGAYEYAGAVTPPPADTTVPTVALTSPVAGSTVSGSVVLAATAADNTGVARVEFRVDGTLLSSDSSAPYAATWDASSAVSGSHTVLATAFDAAGNSANASVSVTVPVSTPVDTTVPVVAITSPTEGATVSGSVALAATGTDTGSGVARMEFRVDGVLVGTDATAPYASTWNASTASIGAHVIDARAYDVAGNAGSFNISVNVAAPTDTTAPTVAITSPAAGSTVSGSVALAATAADNTGVARVEFRVDGTLLSSDSSAPYAATWDASSASSGSHTVLATAFDAAGNSANSSVSVTVPAPADITSPVVTITSPTAGSTVSGSVALAASGTDAGSGVERVEFRVDGVLVGTDTTAPYTATWNAVSAAAGSHVIDVRAYDVAGNAGSSNISVSVAAPADTSVPTVAITSPADGSTVSGSVPLAATGIDSGSGVARMEFRVDGILVGTDTTAPYTAIWNAFAATVGSHVIDARAYDVAGNAGSFNISVNVGALADITAPTVAITAPIADATVADGVSIAANAIDSDSGVSRVEFRADGVLVGSDTTAPYTGTWNAASASSGSHALEAKAIDVAGNSAVKTVQVSIAATVAPQPVLNLTASSASVAPNTYVTLRAQYLVGTVAGPSLRSVALWSDASGAWKKVGTAVYNTATSTYELRVRVKKTTSFQMRIAADALSPALTSNTLQVQSGISVATASAVVPYGATARVVATVTGTNPRRVKIVRARYNSSTKRWTPYGTITARAPVVSAGYARSTTRVSLPRRGRWRIVATFTWAGVTSKSKAAYLVVR